ncbi:MAG: hypothetical protein ACLRTD_07210 [Bacteroides sp.]
MSLADKSCDVPLMVWGEAIKTDRRHCRLQKDRWWRVLQGQQVGLIDTCGKCAIVLALPQRRVHSI